MISYDDIVKEVLQNIPKITVGMKFEVLNSFYPDEDIKRTIKNINESATKPLAVSAKDKIKIRNKKDNILNDFLSFKKTKREKGDIIVVKQISDKYAMCENMSRPKDISEKYYDNYNDLKYVKITYKDILEGNIKHIKRLRSL